MSQFDAHIFAALGDATRLALLAELGAGPACSIRQLTETTDMSRQGVKKHLDILERAQLVIQQQIGRERLYQLRPGGLQRAQSFFSTLESKWDETLQRVRRHVED